jgi:hypothetical protein
MAEIIHKSLTVSGVEITSLSRDELRALVNAIATVIQAGLDKRDTELRSLMSAIAAHEEQLHRRREPGIP